jgi:hypothetical protein
MESTLIDSLDQVGIMSASSCLSPPLRCSHLNQVQLEDWGFPIKETPVLDFSKVDHLTPSRFCIVRQFAEFSFPIASVLARNFPVDTWPFKLISQRGTCNIHSPALSPRPNLNPL